MKTLYAEPTLTVVPALPPATLPDANADDLAAQAAVLTSLGRCWDDLTDDLTTRGALRPLLAFAVLSDIAASHAHPDARAQAAFLMVGVREACDRQAKWDAGALDAWDIVEDWVPGESHDVVEAKLARDLAGALWPLLHALPVTARCRVCADMREVHQQQPGTGSGLCADHRAALAR